MCPTNADRIGIRKQQIEELHDMIDWEKHHCWGDVMDFRGLSDCIVQDYERAIATLEAIIKLPKARKPPAD